MRSRSRMSGGWLLGLAVLAWSGQARAGGCDVDDFQALLHPNGLVAEAQAYWLDRQLVQWPGQMAEPGQRWRLHVSMAGSLSVQAGQAVRGADSSFDLQPDSQGLSPATAERFRFVGAGPRLRLSIDDPARLHRAQLILTRENEAGQVLAFTRIQSPGALDDLYAAAGDIADLGVAVQPAAKSTSFKLWAPTARAVSLCLYDSDASKASAEQAMQFDATTGAWSWRAHGDLSGRYFNYLVEVFVPGKGWVRNRVSDPYSISHGTDSWRSYIADLNAARLKPRGWDQHRRPKPLAAATDMLIYELHVRDFSIADATVPVARRGRYQAFTETRSAGMRHLRSLAQAGMTDVHLLPVFDIASIPEAQCATPTVPTAAADSPDQQARVMAVASKDCFNWGYDPLHYGSPEGSYASSAADGARRIIEFRQMVQSLHEAGLRVGMDVVYNHTPASGQDAKSVLDRIVPGYYQRLDAKGQVERSTCCDNTATEHRMMAKLMIDTTVRWARDYRVDSFRFDLMAHQPRAAMEMLQAAVDKAAGRHVELIGEGWNFGEIANGSRFVQASQLSLNGSGIGTFSDRGRDAARGGSAGDSGEALRKNQGWLNGLVYAPNDAAPKREPVELFRAADMTRVGLAGSLRDFELETFEGKRRKLSEIPYGDQPAGYVSQPGEVVNYVENHDNQTLFDINVMRLPRDTSREDRLRVQMLGAALTAFSQGIAYFHAGLEVLRSKSLDRNSYDSGDWFNRLDWSLRDNGFAAGLPPQGDNGRDWPLLQPLLADDSIKPRPVDIAGARAMFLDLLKIRASSSLLRLRSADEVKRRLHFLNTGPQQNPVVMAAVLDGQGLAGAGFKRLLYLINVSPQAQTLQIESERGHAYRLHPVQASAAAADQRPRREARYEQGSGAFVVPARTAVVWVQE
ncbi:alpha-1,6-glucosidase domain-containing protein [Paucibacter sp. JuS9]|uniref:alpha-1,6-glucosidase domain-containing protein n=1 Tax=Paucibacter sp. JuS9 TaxID=3228748 RepID=UPI0037563999